MTVHSSHSSTACVDSFSAVPEQPSEGLHKFILLDAVKPGSKDGLSGGAGVKIDWDLAKSVINAGEVGNVRSASNGTADADATVTGGKSYPLPIILAGGLTPENIKEAVENVHPWAVDVSGGVENEDGSGKNPEKIRAFVQAAKGL